MTIRRAGGQVIKHNKLRTHTRQERNAERDRNLKDGEDMHRRAGGQAVKHKLWTHTRQARNAERDRNVKDGEDISSFTSHQIYDNISIIA